MLAIDPGPTHSAIVELYSGKIEYASILPNTQLLQRLSAVISGSKPMAIEMIASYGMPAGKDLFETCLWIGRFIQAHGGQHRLVYRKEVVSHVCLSSKAGDKNVRQALIDRFGDPGTKKNPGTLYGIKKDLWSALAVAVTAVETRGVWNE